MRTLVTGACGFVGRYLVGELVSNGYEVLASDIVEDHSARGAALQGVGAEGRGVPSISLPEGGGYRRCDLLDSEAVRELIEDWKPECIFHLAAQSSAARSFEDPVGTLETNVIGMLSILESVKSVRASCEGRVHLLSVGSCEEYGKRSPEDMPLHEESPIEPVSPYAVSKAAQSMLALQYGRAYDLNVCATRSFSHTGPGQTSRFVLPSFAKQCAEINAGIKEPVLKVGNLDVIRDFLDVRDVVRAYRLLIERGEIGRIYNVCSSRGLNLKHALNMMVEQMSVEIRIETDPALIRPADVPVLIGDNSKLRHDTGWEPGISIEQMIRDLMKYWKDVTAARAQ